MKRMFLIALITMGCAPDHAPYAPDCTPETCPEFYEDEPEPSCAEPDAGARSTVGEKHGAQGAATVHTRATTSTRSLDIQWCGSWPCHPWASPSYYYSEQIATCPAGRTCTLRDIGFSFGWDGIDMWTVLPSSVQVCADGLWCGDVTNAHSGISGNRRYGTISWFWGLQWSGSQTFRVWFQYPAGMPLPKYYPAGAVTSFRYTDGV